MSIHASCCAALHLKGGLSGNPCPFRAIVSHKGYLGEANDQSRKAIKIAADHLDRQLWAETVDLVLCPGNPRTTGA
jgi:hypothetical protein